MSVCVFIGRQRSHKLCSVFCLQCWVILCNLLSALSSFSPGRGGANEQLTMLEGQHTTVLYMYVLKRTIDVDIIYIHPFKQSFWNLLTFSLHLLSLMAPL